jgi:hypothetical protein
MGATFNYVKNNVSTEQFNQLATLLTGVNALISQMPNISELSLDKGLGSLLDKAVQ